MTVKVSPADYAKLWKEHLDASTPRIEAGVMRVTVAPGVSAAKAQEKFRKNLLEAIDSGRWAGEVAKVPLADWQERMIKKGIGRIRAGTEAAQAEMEEFGAVLFKHIEAGQAQIADLPSISLDDNIERMVKFIRHMSTLHFRASR